jgi:predicted HNH restriction endonuclease
MKYWIFQANPDYFNVDEYFKATNQVYWSVPKRAKDMKIGDPVVFWRAKGRQKEPKPSGVIAIGKINAEPRHRNELKGLIDLYDHLWLEGNSERATIKVGIMISEYRLDIAQKMIDAQKYIKDEILKNSNIIKIKNSTIFEISENEYEKILKLWGATLTNDDQQEKLEEEVSYLTNEAIKKLTIHTKNERDSKLRKLAVEHFLKIYGKVYCELCGFDFEEKYGEIGRGFIEVHHYHPISQLETEQKYGIEALRLLCANCHRMVHRGDAVINYDYLSMILKAERQQER